MLDAELVAGRGVVQAAGDAEDADGAEGLVDEVSAVRLAAPGLLLLLLLLLARRAQALIQVVAGRGEEARGVAAAAAASQLLEVAVGDALEGGARVAAAGRLDGVPRLLGHIAQRGVASKFRAPVVLTTMSIRVRAMASDALWVICRAIRYGWRALVYSQPISSVKLAHASRSVALRLYRIDMPWNMMPSVMLWTFPFSTYTKLKSTFCSAPAHPIVRPVRKSSTDDSSASRSHVAAAIVLAARPVITSSTAAAAPAAVAPNIVSAGKGVG